MLTFPTTQKKEQDLGYKVGHYGYTGTHIEPFAK